jgi:inosine-uridine nucleoside N-ribohydrolase
VVEARREDGLPLYVACGGPLTNVAAAVQAAPDIAGRMTVLWIGGSLADGRFEYNHDTDPGPLTWCSASGARGLPVPGGDVPTVCILGGRA